MLYFDFKVVILAFYKDFLKLLRFLSHIRLYQDVLMIRPRLYLFNTNTGRWHQLPNYLSWNDLLKAKPKRCVHGGVWGFSGIKLSNVGDSYLWNITSDICRMGLVWIWLLTTNKVCSSQHNVLSVRVFFIQSRRIDHKHGKNVVRPQRRWARTNMATHGRWKFTN